MSLPVHIKSTKDTAARGTYYSVSDYGDTNEKTEYDAEKNVQGLQHSLSTSSYKSISHNDHRHHRFYKPNSNRTWVLLSFLSAISVCILLLELAIHFHPDANAVPKLHSRQVLEEHRGVLWLRQDDLSTGAETTIPLPTPEPTATTTVNPTTEPIDGTIYSPTVDGGDAAAAPTTITPGQPAPDDQITVTDNPTIAPNPADQVTITTDPPTIAPNPDNQVTITTSSPVSSPNSEDQASITSPPSQPRPDDQVTITSEEGITVGQPPPDSQVSITTGNGGSSDATEGVVTMAGVASVVSGSILVSGTAVIGTLKQDVPSGTDAIALGMVTLSNSAGVATATSGYAAVVVATGTNGLATTISYNGDVVLTNSNGVPTKTALYTGTATQAAAVDSNSARATTFNQWSYFLAMYIPNIIGVVLQSSWLVVFATFKMMEPFYQLASPGGGSAQSTLTADYLSTGLSSSIFKTAAEGHWVMVLAGQVQFGLALIMLFVSEAMNVVPTAYCETEVTKKQPCSPKWVVNTDMVRVIEVLLVGCFSMIVMIIVLNRKRVSGVYSDPSRIATMADMLVHKPLIHELRELPTTASKSEIAHDLADGRYVLGTFVDNGREQYGIIKIDVYNERSEFLTKEPFYKSSYRRAGAFFESIAKMIDRTAPFLPDLLCMAFAVALFAIVLAYFAIDGRSRIPFNVWMSSGRVGPGILLSGLAVVMGFLVKRKERYFRLSHPYVVLSKAPALASETITAGTSYTPFTSVYKAMRSQDFSLSLLSLAAIFSDIILILIPGVPFTRAQTRPVYLSSTFTVMGLTTIIFLVLVRVTFKEWNKGRRYSECPDTLAAVLTRLCASRFVEEKNMMNLGPHRDVFNGDDDESQRLRYEGAEGERRYLFGVLEGADGVYRHMVEENLHASKMIHPALR